MNLRHTPGLFNELIPNFKIIERNHNGWKYQSSTTTSSDTNICYTRVKDNGKFREVIEIYSGENYVLNSIKRSYSRVYSIDTLPYKYKSIVDVLKQELINQL